MATAVRVLTTESLDPHLNLATEDWLFRLLPADSQVLLMWRNRPTVVIGRYQNPWLECNLPLMAREGVELARRQSGGGAVYHDQGNTNFTFISPADRYDRDTNFDVVLAALDHLGVAAERSPRNDVIVAGRKISGNAFKHTKERCFHHGTLLVSADLDRLQRYLFSSVQAESARGTRSVRSSVTNLAEHGAVTHDALCAALALKFRERFGAGGATEVLTGEVLRRESSLMEYYRTAGSWQWLYGATPAFTLRFPRGTVEIEHGIIRSVRQLTGVDVDSVAPTLPGLRWGTIGPEDAVNQLDPNSPLRQDFEELLGRNR